MILALLPYLLLIAGSILYVLYCMKPVGDGSMARFRTFMIYTLPNLLSKMGDRIFGPRFSRSANSLKNYIFFSNNPIVMIFYMFVGPGSYLLYIYEIMIGYYGHYNPFHLITGNAMALYAFFMFYKTYATNPGVITLSNNKYYLEKYKTYEDGYIFKSNQICSTCKIIK